MRLDRLHIKNFRCYEDATFDFQPGFNLVVGVNGSGKTSLLQAASTAIAPFINSTGRMYYPSLQSDEQVRFVVDKFEGRVRFERRYPLKIEATGSVFGVTQWGAIKDRKEGANDLDHIIASAMATAMKALDSGDRIDLPVVSFYRANRRWIATQVSPEFAITQKPSRLDGYTSWFDAAIDLRDFESWFIGKTLERLERLANNEAPKDNFDDELAWVNSAICIALPEARGFRYDLKLRTLMVDIASERSLPFNDLSDGQRGMVALIADIARRMCLLNPHMGKGVLSKTSGLIIIDELDIHLHPSWQRSIVSALKTAFPNVQFIAASHSPQIIGSLHSEEVIVLNNRDASTPRVTYGLDSSSVLEEVMDAAKREPEVEALLTELFSTLEDNDLETAKKQLEALKKKAPDLPEFAGAEALIRRKEILGK
jgi:predicted ATP-binding protein involved in virulence